MSVLVGKKSVKVKFTDWRKDLDRPYDPNTYLGLGGGIDCTSAVRYVDIGAGGGAPSGYNFTGSQPFTVEVFLNHGGVDGRGNLFGWTDHASFFIEARLNGMLLDGFHFGFHDTSGFLRSIKFPFAYYERWGRLVAVWDGAKATVYAIDRDKMDSPDSRVDQVAWPAGPLGSAGTLRVGDATYKTAKFGEVRLWNVARTRDQIAATTRGTLEGNESGLVGLWRFDEKTGTTAGNGVAGGTDGTASTSAIWWDPREGAVEIAGTIKPVVFGAVLNAPTVPVSPNVVADIGYQGFDPESHLSLSFFADAVYDKGKQLVLTTDYTVDGVDGFVELVSTPSEHGNVTYDGAAGLTSNREVGTILLNIAQRSGVLEGFETDGTHLSFSAIAGYFIAGGEATAPKFVDIMNELAASQGLWWRITASRLLSMGQVTEPAVTPADTWDKGELLAIDPVPVPPPVWRLSLGYQKNWKVQTGDEVAGSVSDARRQFLANEYRWVSREDQSILDRHPSAREETQYTLLRYKADAEAELLRRWNLFKVPRCAFRVRRSLEGITAPALGSTLAVQYPRFGLTFAVPLLVISRKLDLRKNQVEVVLWGRKPGRWLGKKSTNVVLGKRGSVVLRVPSI